MERPVEMPSDGGIFNLIAKEKLEEGVLKSKLVEGGRNWKRRDMEEDLIL